jgi:hypothetical protein
MALQVFGFTPARAGGQAYFCNHQQAGALRISAGIKQAFNFVRGQERQFPSAILNVGSPASGLGADQWPSFFRVPKTDDRLRCSRFTVRGFNWRHQRAIFITYFTF